MQTLPETTSSHVRRAGRRASCRPKLTAPNRLSARFSVGLAARLAAGLALGLVMLAAGTAHAGQDKARINADGSVDYHIHYAYPPSPEDVAEMNSIIHSASEILCDATEGELYFGDVTMSAGNAGQAIADVWLLPPGLWSRSSSSGFILNDGSRVFLTQQGRTNTTLAHELAHAILRLPDAYNEQSRIGGYFGIGYAVEPGTCSNTGDRCVQDTDCGVGACFFNGITATNNSLMASAFEKARCQANPSEFCPHGDIDCPGGDVCMTPTYYSEFLLPGSYDPLAGNNNLNMCPGPAPASLLMLEGRLGTNPGVKNIDLTSFTTADQTHSGKLVRRIIDSDGVLTGYGRDSSYDLYVYAEYQDAVDNGWRLHFAMNGDRLAVPGVDSLVELAVDVDGNAQPDGLEIQFLSGGAIYPHDGLPANAVEVCDMGVCQAPGSATVIVHIPAFASGAPGIDLEVDLTKLVARNSSDYYLSRSKVLAAYGGQQLGDCAASAAATVSTADDALCNPAHCDGRWNTSTMRWEAAAFTIADLQGNPTFDSEWSRIAALYAEYSPLNLPAEEAFNRSISVPGFITPSTYACPDANIISNVTGNDGMVLLIDVSGSMSIDYDAIGTSKPRLEWAKAAARALADMVETYNAGAGSTTQALGLATFASTATNVLAPVEMGSALEPFTSNDFDLLLNGLQANGATALADGLLTAGAMAVGMNPAIVVLTDGEANVCKDGKDPNIDNCDAKDDVKTVASALAAAPDSIDVYFTPLGATMGQGIFGDAPEVVGGETYPADSAREIPLQFTRSYLRFSGISPIVDGASFSVQPSSGKPWDWATFKIPVEAGANTMTIMLSTRNNDVDSFATTFEVKTPSGVIYNEVSATVIDDGQSFYRIIQVPAGTEGLYWLRVAAGNAFPQSGYVMAWTDTREPDCTVGVSRPVIRLATETMEISALASWDTPLEDVSYNATVTRPDGSKVSVPLDQPDLDSPRYVGQFDQYNGRGLYTVQLSCSTYQSTFHYGEAPHIVQQPEGPDIELPAHMPGPGFTRAAHTAFFADLPGTSTLPPGGDCDNDGIPDSAEGAPSLDTDSDGIIDACDTDSDNDDVPDSDEPGGDLDGDGLNNVLDPDSNGNGIIDGADPMPYRLPAIAPTDSKRAVSTVSGVAEYTGRAFISLLRQASRAYGSSVLTRRWYSSAMT